ncbi:DUF3369 domain-containing protein [Spongiibacter sp. KMU-158]|uniref:DUF3369 domain-containing protein n=1 Tax=Spongiibacter pelagi TaxID=2760804 RepID=A0A927BZC6_9GAMM|nr:HD domain-containing phosphohydrolase [Spongiibacter pelagi]MBD2858374.1 DUF3369 domain-containing protein [Spongiibacter pelagi]
MSLNDDDLIFADDADGELDESGAAPWKILIVDDEEEIHRVTKLSLGENIVHGRPLSFLHAYTGESSVEIMREQPDIALVLMDVVMESEHAGLQAVERIREELGNTDVRLVLRTGQPGQAPEKEVVTRYDINDYKEKTELTSKKLHTLLHTSLSHYRELVALKQNRLGLEKVIKASGALFKSPSMQEFASGVLTQLAALLYVSEDIFMVRGVTVGSGETGDLRIIASAGGQGNSEGMRIEDALPEDVVERIIQSLKEDYPLFGDKYFVASFSTRSGSRYIIYIANEAPISVADRRLIEMFCNNIGIAFENHAMYQEVVDSQHRLVLLLSTAVEERSKELNNHVRRVSEYALIIGRQLGLNDKELEQLQLSAALHDIGKIAIPDEVLNKPGKLTDAERAVMETHVERGENILGAQDGSLLKSAANVVGAHHEHWDGGGYPRKLKGGQIPFYGRITAIADVFDALSTKRVYKEAWPMEEVLEYFRDQRGRQFDPELVDVFLANIEEVLEIHRVWHA